MEKLNAASPTQNEDKAPTEMDDKSPDGAKSPGSAMDEDEAPTQNTEDEAAPAHDKAPHKTTKMHV